MRGFLISEQSEILHMRREAEALAKGLGFSPEDCGRLAIIATELATNLLKHAGHGEILLGLSENTSVPCVELIALDQGPGMVDVDACLVDGYSTAGSQGTGLGAAKRQATSFDIYSGLNLGAAVHVRVCPSKTKFKPRDSFPWAVLWRALPGEDFCGDGFAVRNGTDGFLAMVADGLGHGAFAAQASGEAIRIFEKSNIADPDALLGDLHLGLRATRGAAISVAKIEQSRGTRYVFGHRQRGRRLDRRRRGEENGVPQRDGRRSRASDNGVSVSVQRRRARDSAFGRTCEQLVSRQVSRPCATRSGAYRRGALP